MTLVFGGERLEADNVKLATFLSVQTLVLW